MRYIAAAVGEAQRVSPQQAAVLMRTLAMGWTSGGPPAPHSPTHQAEILPSPPLCLARSSSSQPAWLLKPNVPGWQSITQHRTQASHLSCACTGKDDWPILFFAPPVCMSLFTVPLPGLCGSFCYSRCLQGCPDPSAACCELCSRVHLSASLTSHTDAKPCVEPFPPQQ